VFNIEILTDKIIHWYDNNIFMIDYDWQTVSPIIHNELNKGKSQNGFTYECASIIKLINK
jgi:hypothetical protein